MIATLLVLAPPVEAPRVAYVARFYKPGKAVSRPQVYIDGYRGKKRRQLTFGKATPSQVSWIGKQTLAWIETVGENSSLVKFDLKSRRKSRIASARDGGGQDYDPYLSFRPRGWTVYRLGKDAWVGSNDKFVRNPKAFHPGFKVMEGDRLMDSGLPNADVDLARWWLPSGQVIRFRHAGEHLLVRGNRKWSFRRSLGSSEDARKRPASRARLGS